MTTNYQIILSTCPDIASARTIATAVVEQGLAACVNIVPGVESIYQWQGAIEQSNELLLIIKTQTECYAALEQMILTLHPYELPEIIAVPLTTGLPAYLSWIDANLKQINE
ncbi:MAG: divalent-cation tolerance protein CutA [Pseudomonadota bacterium]|nr:divalent-cation tolerance protein CutA [Pseudomonadota bacterium]